MNINRSVCTVYGGEANCAGNPIQKVETQASERFDSEKTKMQVFFLILDYFAECILNLIKEKTCRKLR